MNLPAEIEAAITFQLQFRAEYGGIPIRFHECTLEEAMATSCHVPNNSRKILGLYLHNQNDIFTKNFCSAIQTKEISDILERCFYLIGWNIANNRFHKALNKTLKKCFGATSLESIVSKGHAAFVIMFTIENEVFIYSLLHGDVHSKNDILTILREAENSFNDANNCGNELQVLNRDESNIQSGSTIFQQRMSDLLGDRDYDKFEANEHELLKDKIGYAKFGPPGEETGYNVKQKQIIEATYEKIREHSNYYSEYEDQIIISFIYNCLEPLPKDKESKAKQDSQYDPMNDFLPESVFVIRKCIDGRESCRLFIDNDDRVYNSWMDYLRNNKHCKCLMRYPNNGRYSQNENGEVILQESLSPACDISSKLINITDIGASVSGISAAAVSGIALIPAVTIAPAALIAAGVVGAGVGVYSIVRSGLNLYDRKQYGESMSFSNSQARGAYFNIAAGSFGFLGVGATATLSQLAMRGVNITKGAQLTVNAINICNVTASGVSIGNSTYEVLQDWIVEQQAPSALTVLQLTSSILFFANATINFKSAAAITEEAQIGTLKKYQDSLRSNRHRKIFNKMLKETTRQNSGNKITAYADVISACRKIPDKDTVFAVLTRNNKLFNKDGIRFFVENGEIKLNGVSVDMIEFGDMSNTSRSEFLSSVPSIPEPVRAPNNGLDRLITIENAIIVSKYINLINSGARLASILHTIMQDFSLHIQQKILKILKAVLDQLLYQLPKLDMFVKKYLCIGRVSEPIQGILEIILAFIKKQASDLENTYLQERQAVEQLPDFNEEEFNRRRGIVSNTLRTSLPWIERAIELILYGGRVDEQLLKHMVQYICSIITESAYEYSLSIEDATVNRTRRGEKRDCAVCAGHNFCSM